MTAELEIRPATAERWEDLARLFGPSGACYGCWCMWWRLSGPEFEKLRAAGRRAALERLVKENRVPGLLACRAGQAVGWCALAPREEFVRLSRSPVLKPVDASPAWSVPCFFVHPQERGRGVAEALLAAAAHRAEAAGARLLEGYPVEPPASPLSAYVGVTPMFSRAGFREVARRRPRRPILRLELQPSG